MLRQLGGALSDPLAGPDWRLGTALVGGLLLAGVYVPLLPYVPVLGYLSAVAAASGRAADEPERTADPTPPDPTALRTLLSDGVRASVVTVAFLLPPTALLTATVGTAMGGEPSFGPVRGMLFPIAAVFTLTVALAVAYPLPASLALVGHTGRLRAGFDRAALGRAVRSGRYMANWVAGVAVLAVGVGLGEPLFDVAVGYFVVGYGLVAAAHLWGDGCGDAVAGLPPRENAATDRGDVDDIASATDGDASVAADDDSATTADDL